jgi:hypothetical protein
MLPPSSGWKIIIQAHWRVERGDKRSPGQRNGGRGTEKTIIFKVITDRIVGSDVPMLRAYQD